MSRDYRVRYVMEDEAAATELITAARLHCKLSLVYGMVTTTPDRRKAIIKIVESLRVARETILGRFKERESYEC